MHVRHELWVHIQVVEGRLPELLVLDERGDLAVGQVAHLLLPGRQLTPLHRRAPLDVRIQRLAAHLLQRLAARPDFYALGAVKRVDDLVGDDVERHALDR